MAFKRCLDSDDQKTEKTRCFDLLDAMSCSGSLPIECATLHVVVAGMDAKINYPFFNWTIFNHLYAPWTLLAVESDLT